MEIDFDYDSPDGLQGNVWGEYEEQDKDDFIEDEATQDKE